MSMRNAPRTNTRTIALALAALLVAQDAAAQSPPSTCYGTYWNGRLENGVPLPLDGKNFRTYTPRGNELGRTFVHSAIYDILLAAYDGVHNALPDVTFVYGETGFKHGGPIPPHRTHQTGLSVDFFVPLRDAAGRSVPMPIDASNKWGYDIAFDQAGRLGDLSIDFDAIAEHLYHLSEAAKARKIGIRVVILDPPLQPKLLGTKRGASIRHLPYMKERAWSRHDNHYHVDFIVPCKPLPGRKADR